jgi:uncharacterized damage-inducible protein DinB
MRQIATTLTLLLAVAGSCFAESQKPTPAQKPESAQKAAAAQKSESAQKPADAKDWIDQWNDVTGRVTGVAEAMPAEKYDYKPTQEVGTFGDQVKHLCMAMRVLLANAEGNKIPLEEVNLDSLKTKDEILAELHKRVDEGAAVIKRISGRTDADVVDSQFFGKTTRRFLVIQAIAHDNNHYGQLVMYLRLNGITPPASR